MDEQFDVESEEQMLQFVSNLVTLRDLTGFVELVTNNGFERFGRPWLDLTRVDAFKTQPIVWRLLEDIRESFHEVLVDDQNPDDPSELTINEIAVMVLHEHNFAVYEEDGVIYVDMGDYLV